MNVLLSIKPKYVKLIKSGLKKYEFRRKIFKNDGKCKIFIYSSFPVCKIEGLFKPKIFYDSPYRIWNRFSEFSGLSEREFFHYFINCDTAYAIEISDLIIFNEPLNPYKLIKGFKPPQSYCYLKEFTELKKMKAKNDEKIY